jgi:hypothetical protein
MWLALFVSKLTSKSQTTYFSIPAVCLSFCHVLGEATRTGSASQRSAGPVSSIGSKIRADLIRHRVTAQATHSTAPTIRHPVIRHSVLSDVPCRKAPFYQHLTQRAAQSISLPHHHAPSTFHVLSFFAVQALAWPCSKEKEWGSEPNTRH